MTTPANPVPLQDTRAEIVVDPVLKSGPIYNDGTYKYFGEAAPGTALTDASWQVSRMTIATGAVDWADGNGLFDNVFTNLATVQAMSFS